MPTNTSPTRPTREQVLFGLRVCLRETDYSEYVFDAETFFVFPKEMDRVKLAVKYQHQLASYNFGNDFDFHWDFIEPVEAYFGLNEGEVAWEEIFESAQVLELTYGDVADFIAKYLPEKLAFEPVTLLSKPCQPAGVFLGLQDLANRVDPKLASFGPSTSVRLSLRGKSLLKFCQQLHWATTGLIPSPPDVLRKGSWPRRVIQLSIAFLIAWLLLGAYQGMILRAADWVSFESWFSVFFAAEAGAILFYVVAYNLIRWRWNPLPPGIITFRDLALLISDRMQKQAEQTSPNVQVT